MGVVHCFHCNINLNQMGVSESLIKMAHWKKSHLQAKMFYSKQQKIFQGTLGIQDLTPNSWQINKHLNLLLAIWPPLPDWG